MLAACCCCYFTMGSGRLLPVGALTMADWHVLIPKDLFCRARQFSVFWVLRKYEKRKKKLERVKRPTQAQCIQVEPGLSKLIMLGSKFML
ncbi:hypothetical protein L3X38_038399 [Prunus dulcis]|uniref:Uncharacterized protein n=1 Tax=Prunus dulcis TaxID=3755 RepID=A0AAD4V7D5_PRUDU|nr:hypothetical protein L3X38_038399 [Prunus dulcis]